MSDPHPLFLEGARAGLQKAKDILMAHAKKEQQRFDGYGGALERLAGRPWTDASESQAAEWEEKRRAAFEASTMYRDVANEIQRILNKP